MDMPFAFRLPSSVLECKRATEAKHQGSLDQASIARILYHGSVFLYGVTISPVPYIQNKEPMGYSPDKRRPLVQTDIDLVGMNGAEVSANEILNYVGTSDTYFLNGFVFQMTTGIITVEQFVENHVLAQDSEYQRIEGQFHKDDTAVDIEIRAKKLEDRKSELIAHFNTLSEDFPHGILLAFSHEIVLSEFQLASLNRVDKEVLIIQEDQIT